MVAPGYVKTRLTDVLPEDATKAMLDARRSDGSASRRTWPGRYASSASDAASFITGEVLLVDGGLGM